MAQQEPSGSVKPVEDEEEFILTEVLNIIAYTIGNGIMVNLVRCLAGNSLIEFQGNNIFSVTEKSYVY